MRADAFVLDHVGVSPEMFFYEVELSRGQIGLDTKAVVGVEMFQNCRIHVH